MTYEVGLTDAAFGQLESAHAWWMTNRSPAQAARWYNSFARAIVSLGNTPGRWPFAAENGTFPYEIRELHFGLAARPTHRAVFTIRERMVLVVAVRHLAQRAITPQDV